MRILDATSSYHPAGGGVKTYLHEKRRYLLEQTEHEHVLLVPGDEDRVEVQGRASLYNVKAPLIPGSEPYRMILNTRKVRRLLEEIQPDVVELGSQYFLPRPGVGYRKKHPSVLAGFYHTDFPKAYVETALRPLVGDPMARRARKITARWAKATFRKFDVMYTASEVFRRQLTAIGVPNVEYLPLGVDTRTFHPQARDEAVRARFGVTKDQVFLVFVGRFDQEKRVPLLFEMMERLEGPTEYRMLLIGGGPMQAEFQARADRDGRIFLLPYQREREDLAALLASADLYVSAAPHETFGLSVIEAQSCGLGVVGVRAGAMIDRVPSEVGALAAPGSSEDLARCVQSVVQDRLRKTGAAARRMVEAEFSWDRTFERQMESYARHLEAARG